MRIIGAFIALFFVLTSCDRNDSLQAVRYHDDGRAKPIVSFVPVIEQTPFEFPWSLSDEFTTDIYNLLVKKDNLFLKNQDLEKSKNFESNPFENDLAWLKTTYEGSEYVVFLGLVQHSTTPIFTDEKTAETKHPQNLEMIMRVRVIDLRQNQPQIILQELIHQNHHIPKFLSDIDYKKCRWGTKRYRFSPIGIGHRHFTKEIANRLEDYILLSQSR